MFVYGGQWNVKYTIQFCTLRVTEGDFNPHLHMPQHELTSCLPHEWAEQVKAAGNMVWYILSPVITLNTIYTAMDLARIPAMCPVWEQTIWSKEKSSLFFSTDFRRALIFFSWNYIYSNYNK